MGDALLMAMALNKAGRAPSLMEFYGRTEEDAPRGGRFGTRRVAPGKIQTTSASTAEDFRMMTKSGWAVKGKA